VEDDDTEEDDLDEDDVDFELITEELQTNKAGFRRGSLELQAVETLEKASKAHNWEAIRSALGQFAAQFTSATLIQVAGRYLSGLLGLGQ